MVTKGYIVASVEYRFSQKAKFPAQIQDCQAAIRWLRAHRETYHIDPMRVGVGGGSAGVGRELSQSGGSAPERVGGVWQRCAQQS